MALHKELLAAAEQMAGIADVDDANQDGSKADILAELTMGVDFRGLASVLTEAVGLLAAARAALAVARWPQGVSEDQYNSTLDALEAVIRKAEGQSDDL